MKILFVCQANHGRSQVAEALFKKLCGGKHEAFSAGTKVKEKDREGHKITDPNIFIVMKEEGIDVSENVRNQLTLEMIENAGKVIVMAESETLPEYLKLNDKVIYWEIPDFYNQTLEFVREGKNKLKVLIQDLIKTLD